MISRIIPPLKQYLLKRLIENRVKFERPEVEFAYLRSGMTNNPFHFIQIKTDFDNRCQDDLKIEYIFIKTYINGAPWGFIIWQHAQKEYPHPEEVSTYPSGFNFPKNDKSLIRLGISIPPFVSLEERLYVTLFGYIILKSSLGSFTKEISDEVWVDKEQWK